MQSAKQSNIRRFLVCQKPIFTWSLYDVMHKKPIWVLLDLSVHSNTLKIANKLNQPDEHTYDRNSSFMQSLSSDKSTKMYFVLNYSILSVNYLFSFWPSKLFLWKFLQNTVPIDKILSVKNARAWVSMVSYLKKNKKNIKEKKNPGSRLEVAC